MSLVTSFDALESIWLLFIVEVSQFMRDVGKLIFTDMLKLLEKSTANEVGVLNSCLC